MTLKDFLMKYENNVTYDNDDLIIVNDTHGENLLSYPLTSIPLSLSHVDGSIHKTPKSAILNHLESKIVSTQPKGVDVTIVDRESSSAESKLW